MFFCSCLGSLCSCFGSCCMCVCLWLHSAAVSAHCSLFGSMPALSCSPQPFRLACPWYALFCLVVSAWRDRFNCMSCHDLVCRSCFFGNPSIRIGLHMQQWEVIVWSACMSFPGLYCTSCHDLWPCAGACLKQLQSLTCPVLLWCR